MNLSNGYKFSGVVLEMVRSFLADWINNHPSEANGLNWTPVLQTNPKYYPSDGQFSIWEFQLFLQESNEETHRTNKNLPVFILAFPGTQQFSADELPQTNSLMEHSPRAARSSQDHATSNEPVVDDGFETCLFL